MSVYTALTEDDFSQILNNYELGQLLNFQGIEAGIDNTNYFLTTAKGEYVFTLFENININELRFYLALLNKFFVAGLHCPQPQPDIKDEIIGEFREKPFTIVSRIKGNSLKHAEINHCSAIAEELAKLHSIKITDIPTLKNRRGSEWRLATFNKIKTFLSDEDTELINNELVLYASINHADLPQGFIHADLFRDNALFENNILSGIIDFYDACFDVYLYDVAITVNDWCTEDNGVLNLSLYNTFLCSYQKTRPFTQTEKTHWALMLRIAAMRFWLSRLDDSFHPRQGDLTQSKDPALYKSILKYHILHPANLT